MIHSCRPWSAANGLSGSLAASNDGDDFFSLDQAALPAVKLSDWRTRKSAASHLTRWANHGHIAIIEKSVGPRERLRRGFF